MDDLLLKYAMIIVGVVIFGLLLSFAFRALKANPIPEERFQNYNQEPKNAVNYFIKLCEICVAQENFDRDCYIVDYDNPGPNTLTPGMLVKNFEKVPINLSTQLPPGIHTLKIHSQNNFCNISKLT